MKSANAVKGMGIRTESLRFIGPGHMSGILNPALRECSPFHAKSLARCHLPREVHRIVCRDHSSWASSRPDLYALGHRHGRAEAKQSIRRRLFDVVDHKDNHRPRFSDQFQTKLVLKRLGEAGPVRIGLLAVNLSLGNELDPKVIIAR
jgi:hypothetical protein